MSSKSSPVKQQPTWEGRRKKESLNATEKRILAKMPLPLEKEPCTMKELKECIPKELFQFDMATSWYYIFLDFVKLAVVSGISYGILEYVLPPASTSFLVAILRTIVVLATGFANGTTCFGIWVIAHECGHQAYFGTMKSLNDAVGLVLHSALLVPYHSWRITHGTHHKYTNNLQRDTAFPPMMTNFINAQTYEDIPMLQLLPGLVYMVIGFPIYLSANLAGHWYPESWANHFNPWAPMFKKSERQDIVISVIGFVAALAGVAYWAQQMGFWHMAQWYGLAWVGCNSWLVTITLLQHQHPECPHYDDDEFTFLKGALSTVDRNYYGFNDWMHNITNHHVTHHVFSTMPFYNAKKATPFVAAKLGPKFYHYDNRPMWTQFWEAVNIRESSYLVWQRQPDGAELKHLKLSH